MKKSLLALAALTAFAGAASAQSTVTLSGIFKAGVASTKFSNGASNNGSGLGVADGSSRFIIGVAEDLGGGLFAVAQMDQRFRIDDNGGNGAAPTSAVTSQIAGGNTWVGLRGGFGQFRMGKFDTHYCVGIDSHSARATALTASSCNLLSFVNGSGGGQAIANSSRSTNIIRYDLPTMGGLNGNVSYSTAWSSTEGLLSDNKGKAMSGYLSYTVGPVKVEGSVWDAKNEPRTGGQKAYTLAGNFNLGAVQVGLAYDQSKLLTFGATSTTELKRNVWSVPVVVPVGAGAFLFTYTKAGDAKNNAGTVANTGATQVSVGFDYSLSKRTSVGVSYVSLNNKSAALYNLYTLNSLIGHGAGTNGGNAIAGQDAKQLYFGVRHAF